MGKPKQDESYNPLAVTGCILLADGILFMLVYFGKDHQIDNGILPASTCPVIDSLVNDHCLKSAAVIIHVLTAGAALYWHRKLLVRDFLNILLLVEIIIASGWWTAYTGGLSKSLYASGYLALFPVATIVPRARWVKLVGALVVASVALIIAWNTPDHGRELFIWTSSIVGCSIGWIIQQFLAKLRREDTEDTEEDKNDEVSAVPGQI